MSVNGRFILLHPFSIAYSMKDMLLLLRDTFTGGAGIVIFLVAEIIEF